jgi:Ca2+-binding EF-hand superfamily protein
VIEKYRQQQKAERVFELLDEAGKGVVVVQDLERVAAEIMGEDITAEELAEMIQEIDRSGDGLLVIGDIIRLAGLVGL